MLRMSGELRRVGMFSGTSLWRMGERVDWVRGLAGRGLLVTVGVQAQTVAQCRPLEMRKTQLGDQSVGRSHTQTRRQRKRQDVDGKGYREPLGRRAGKRMCR